MIFQVGQKVRLKVKYGRRIAGATGVVAGGTLDQNEEHCMYVKMDEDGSLCSAFPRRFELVEEAPVAIQAGVDVVCIDARDSIVLRLKQRYTVEKVTAKGYIKLEGINSRYHAARFKVVPKKEAAKPFDNAAWEPQVGEKVLIVGKDNMHNGPMMDKFINDGVEYTITHTKDRWGGRIRLEGHGYIYYKTSLRPVDAGAVTAKPIPKPKPVLPDLKDELNKKGYGGGICSFAFEFDDGRQDFRNDSPCHAALGYDLPGKIVKLAYCIRKELRGQKPSPNYLAYVDYIIAKSPWADAFLTHDAVQACAEDIYLNVEKNRYVIAGACVALRQASEHSDRLPLFNLLLAKGHNPHTCWLLCCAFTKGGGSYSFAGWTGGHDVLDQYRDFDEVIKFFKQGYHTRLGITKEPFSTHHGQYVIAEAVAKGNRNGVGKDSIGGWLADNTKHKSIGEGWNKETIITEEAILEVATKIDNLLKEDK